MDILSGKTAVVTGAASGIGAALSSALSDQGMHVVMADIEERALDCAVAELRSRHADVIGVLTNVMSDESDKDLERVATNRFGAIHLLCNNAGIASSSGHLGMLIWEQSLEDWAWALGVNFYGVLRGLRAFVPSKIAHGQKGTGHSLGYG
ncbi:MAG: SDR family NAD(P)-dependent oxidoreductase [Pseudomonadota bacterium]